MGASASAQRRLAAFVYHYKFQRPYRALDNRTPVEEVQNRWLDNASRCNFSTTNTEIYPA
jgi:hypothetical protein